MTLYETQEKRVETKMIQLPWGGPVPVSQKQNEEKRQRGFTEKCTIVSVCGFQLFPTLSYSNHTYISGNKKRKEADYIFIQVLFFFLEYDT